MQSLPDCFPGGPGQLYWYDGSHVDHIFSRRVQRVTERFLRVVAEEVKSRTAE